MVTAQSCYCQTKSEQLQRPLAQSRRPACSASLPTRSLRSSTQGKGKDASRPLGPALICALGARGILLRLFFEKTPQKKEKRLHVRLDGTATIHDAVAHRDRPGLPPLFP